MKFIQKQRDHLVKQNQDDSKHEEKKPSNASRKLILGTVLSVATAFGLTSINNEEKKIDPPKVVRKAFKKHHKTHPTTGGEWKGKWLSDSTLSPASILSEPPKHQNELIITKSQIEKKLLSSKVKKGEVTYEKDFIRFRGYYSKYLMSIPFNIKASFFKKDDVIGLKVIEMKLNGYDAPQSSIDKVQLKMNKLVTSDKIKVMDFVKINDNGKQLYRQEL